MNPTKFASPGSALPWIELLDRDGYCIIPNLLPERLLADLDEELDPVFAATPFCVGGFYGERTKRFGRLLARADRAARLVQNEIILEIADAVLGPWCDSYQLNLTQAIEIHPRAMPQLPHRDQDMWPASKGQAEYLLNVIWPLGDFTEENGATLVWPRSHGQRALNADPPKNSPIVAECGRGSAVVFLGSTLHGAGGNRSARARRGIIVSYSLGWLKPYENQWLAYPPEIARHFPRALAGLAGYRQHRPNLGNYEGRCPSVLLDEAVDERIGATDALRPDQQVLLADYIALQHQPAPAGPVAGAK